MKHKEKMKRSYSDKIFDFVNLTIMVISLVIFIWPLWFVVIASVSSPDAVYTGQVLILPKQLSFEGYKLMLNYTELWTGYRNSIFYTVVGTIASMIMSICMAYPLAGKRFMPRKILFYYFLFTVYFSGGMIPVYLVVKSLGLINSPWVLIVVGALSVHNALLLRNYFSNSIPYELEEASLLDGANAAQYLWSVVLPLSKPILAVVTLYYAVSKWNDYYTALLYIHRGGLRPIQSVLRDLLSYDPDLNASISNAQTYEEMMKAYDRSMQMRYCVIIAAALPLLMAYPFVQKHFIRGRFAGSVKG